MMDNNSNYEERKVSKFLYLSSSLCNYDPTAAPTSHNIYVRKYREKEMAGKKKKRESSLIHRLSEKRGLRPYSLSLSKEW